ncbi:zinc finger transcription factor [Colletotrichum asianum]|uniref:Zinc finger transcription factor n=1 Tax=Colletotrichum asianum TaxID=702518 RepID=A0A8H3ZH30_9PEZI|nr:zinc finger transcription factor [Colletotrichum asianum]
MQKSHRRSTKVCTRCRQRKTKCDFKFPECTSCKLAGAPCLGFDPATRTPVPRSLVKSLEARVAELEAQVLASRAGHQQYPSLMASKIAQATISFGTPITGSYPLSKISPNLFMRPSCPPLAISAIARAPDPELGSDQTTQTHESPANREGTVYPANPYTSNLINLKNIPNWALDRMVRNYADTHLPQYPCIPEALLETALPLRAPSSDEASAYFKVDDMIKKSSANHLYRYRALETEVHRVLYLQEDIPALNGTTIGDWMLDSSSRLETWYANAQTYTQYNMLEFKHVQFNHLKARIHRPTPRLRTRLPENWGIVLESCERLIEDYVSQERRGRLFYPWHGVHILFETAMIALHASWSSREYQPFRDQAGHMVQTLLPQCLQVLTNIGQRWGEATRCADKLRPLVQKVSPAFTWANRLPVHEAVLIEDEIESLIFSDKNLSWNAVTLENSGLGFEDGALLIDNMLVDDLNALQWAPDWDLVFGEIL